MTPEQSSTLDPPMDAAAPGEEAGEMRSDPQDVQEILDGPSGIGGWLILPLLNLIVSSVTALYGLYTIGGTVFSPGVWDEDDRLRC